MRLLEAIGEPAMLEMLAEECVELAHAALKLARVEREENPTPKSREECIAAMHEEVVDEFICLGEIMNAPWWDKSKFEGIERTKYQRMRDRLEEKEKETEGKREYCMAYSEENGGNVCKITSAVNFYTRENCDYFIRRL